MKAQRIRDLSAWIDEKLKNGKLNAAYKRFNGSELPPNM
jgi:hypothetical protein